jgi:hypothetical protein
MNDERPHTDSPEAVAPELARLVEVVERLHRDHTVSFIAAGDEKIYAYGGGGFIAIVSDRLFDDPVDVETPTAKFRIERDADGRMTAVSVTGEDVPTAKDFVSAAEGFERYYARRIGSV